MSNILNGAEIKIFIKLVSGQNSCVGKATISVRGKFSFNEVGIGGALEISGFRIWRRSNARTNGSYLISPPSYQAGQTYKPYFFAVAFTEDTDQKKQLWYKLEDSIVQAFEDKLLEEPKERKEGEEINLDEIPF